MPKKGYKQTEEHKRNMAASLSGKKASAQTREKFRVARKRRPLKLFCNKGHDVALLGRNHNSRCVACRLEEGWKRRGIKDLDGSAFSISTFKIAYNDQKGLCAICKASTATSVDHDHSNGLFRGLLCKTCNASLGHYEKIKEAAEAYLKKEVGGSIPSKRTISAPMVHREHARLSI